MGSKMTKFDISNSNKHFAFIYIDMKSDLIDVSKKYDSIEDLYEAHKDHHFIFTEILLQNNKHILSDDTSSWINNFNEKFKREANHIRTHPLDVKMNASFNFGIRVNDTYYIVTFDKLKSSGQFGGAKEYFKLSMFSNNVRNKFSTILRFASVEMKTRDFYHHIVMKKTKFFEFN